MDSLRLGVGDYVKLADERHDRDGPREGEWFARVERAELVPAERLVEARFGLALPALAVFARSMPGPVLLRAGDHGVLTAPDPARVAHDIAHPSWPARGTVFFAGARLATPTAQVTTPNRDQMVGSPPPIRAALRRATAVSLPAAGLRVGDYLETIAERFPPRDRAPDEGSTASTGYGCWTHRRPLRLSPMPRPRMPGCWWLAWSACPARCCCRGIGRYECWCG